MKKITILNCLLFLLVLNIFSQKEANVWYFGKYAGVDFGYEPPLVLPSNFKISNMSCMSDAEGNYLFTSNGRRTYNKNGQLMQNGSYLLPGDFSGGTIILQKPGSDHLYYIFVVASHKNSQSGLYYSVVDMNLDDGQGAVTSEKGVLLNSAWDALEKVTAVRHSNNKDIWIITRKSQFSKYAAFLLTENGIADTAILSDSPYRPSKYLQKRMKVSPDKKYLIAPYGETNGNPYETYDVCNFNANTGAVNILYTIDPNIVGDWEGPNSVEFSPDSKLVYLNNLAVEPTLGLYIRQYDMAVIEDSTQFVESAILITNKGGRDLQLARDGKIYCGEQVPTLYTDSLSVIHRPWVRGTGCNFEENVISFENDRGVDKDLPNILLDYLYRFEWEGKCTSSPFVFQHNFQPVPEYIAWTFDDPGSGTENSSSELNPEHSFTHAGEFEVSVTARYPSGRIERTSRVVTVSDAPHPDLGPDIIVCENEEVVLNAGDYEGMYGWSNGIFGQNVNEIVVSDSGWYRVTVMNGPGCFGADTIYVGWYPKAEINEDNLQLVPTSCGGTNGKILGLSVTGQDTLTFAWYDADTVLIGTDLDLENLSAGNYYLHILDGNGCTTISEAYTITDAGDIEINEVEKEDTHCNQAMGSITIHAESASTDELLYSIDNGNSWQNGDSVYINLPPGNYLVKVMDTTGCESVYENNPVVIENIEGPEVLSATSQPEVDYLSNGEIDISAMGFGNLFYSIDNGNSFQTNDGVFSGLSAGSYSCVVKDDYGCDTTFVVEVDLVISQLIEAIAGNGYTCIGNAAVVPLKLTNFSDILSFTVKLTYDTSMLSCDGYINIHPKLEENMVASIIPGTDEVIINWQGDIPVSLEENAIMLELVFGAKKEGFTNIDWAALPGESVFYNETGDEISADYHFGSLRIYTRPEILIPDDRKVCDGEFLFMSPYVSGGTGDLSYLWQGPNGFESTKDYVEFQNVDLSNAGIYTLTVTDTIDCVESAEVKVTVHDNPQIAFQEQDTIFGQPGFILDAGSGYQNYLWNTGDTTNAITIDLEGLYSVLITSSKSCKSSDSVTVLWEQSAFYLPNAFSPNGDGLNDEFKPVQKYDFINSYHMQIFNRWGQLIFETTDINQGWDGNHNGNPVWQGSFVYKIIYTAWPDKDKQQVEMGVVTLVR